MVNTTEAKRDFATRLPPRTLAQLDELVKRGVFKNRTTAIEAAVERLYEAGSRDMERRRRAFERACGALSLGSTRESLREAEWDRLDWEASRRAGWHNH